MAACKINKYFANFPNSRRLTVVFLPTARCWAELQLIRALKQRICTFNYCPSVGRRFVWPQKKPGKQMKLVSKRCLCKCCMARQIRFRGKWRGLDGQRQTGDKLGTGLVSGCPKVGVIAGIVMALPMLLPLSSNQQTANQQPTTSNGQQLYSQLQHDFLGLHRKLFKVFLKICNVCNFKDFKIL